MSSFWRSRLDIAIFGQSHAPGIGMTLDGIPAGETIDMERLQAFLKRRAPGRFPWSTPRKEEDIPEFICGLVNDKTCGAPITAIIRNTNTRSVDYAQHADIPRPGHADYTAHVKYDGHQDVAGGGHFSGRLTAALCVAGGICLQILERRGVTIGAHIETIAGCADRPFDPVSVDAPTLKSLWEKDLPTVEDLAAGKMIEEIGRVRALGDSLGGSIECAVVGLPAGLGNPIFGGMENRISSLAFGVPAVKGIEFGTGFGAASLWGSEHNDPFYMDGNAVKTRTNNHGGILGGITTGMPLIFRVAIKPTPSIAIEQQSVSLSKGEPDTLAVKGRHDPCIVPRAVPCIEAVAAIAILDAMLDN
ncbi:MAG: chorismate synthase [Oscillospiraceae bacterium]|nr:chorismate synthase [Oscillospiraceae bacterium]